MGKSYKGVSLGITTVLTVFAVLCLTIFGVLTASTAAQERELAEKYARSVEDYWACDSACADTANALGALWESGADKAALRAAALQLGAIVTESGDDLLIQYSVSENDVSRMEVTLRLGAAFTVERWSVTSADAQWSPDTSLPVWTGEREVE
jgi:hypothetical protein